MVKTVIHVSSILLLWLVLILEEKQSLIFIDAVPYLTYCSYPSVAMKLLIHTYIKKIVYTSSVYGNIINESLSLCCGNILKDQVE